MIGRTHRAGLGVIAQERFDRPLHVDEAKWVKDPQGSSSPWHVGRSDDDGAVWRVISDPDFSEALGTFGVSRKRVKFGTRGWLTAEIAAQDKDNDGAPGSQPGPRTVMLDNGQHAAQIHEPSWDAGVLIRSTHELPAQYRVEVTLRGLDFGGECTGSLRYDGKFNGYRQTGCRTSYPWTFRGAIPDRVRCDHPSVPKENGFYYLTILDYATPAPHGNPGIHYRRKVIMDGYNSVARWSRKNAVCNPATGRIKSVAQSNHNAVNAIFVRGDRFRRSNNNVSNEYFFRTSCGDFSGDGTWGCNGQYRRIMSTAGLQPEPMPQASYTFAVERDTTGHTIEMSGPFRHTGQTTLRYHHDFVENGRPIWHYNPSAYPDSFIIGDPHLNFYEGSPIVDDIRLYVPQR